MRVDELARPLTFALTMEIWIHEVSHHGGGAISHVCARTCDRTKTSDLGNWVLGDSRRYTKEQVLGWLRAGYDVFTAVKKPNTASTYLIGARVIQSKQDPRYITTEKTPHLYDNLGELPPCTC